MNEKTVIQRVKELMKAKGENAASFAKEIGVPQTTFNRYIAQDKTPTIECVISILATFPDISPDWLLLGTGPMYREGKSPDITVTSNNNVQKGRNNINASSNVEINEHPKNDSKDMIIQKLFEQNQKLLDLVEKNQSTNQ